MPDAPTDHTDAGPGLAGLVAGVVITTPGVIRLEPTRDGALRRAVGRQFSRASGTLVDHTDGVVVRTPAALGRDGATIAAPSATVTVTVEIAITTPPTAIEVAIEVRGRIEQVLADHGLTASTLRVNILSIETVDPVEVRLDR